jgi:hypothetical protein
MRTEEAGGGGKERGENRVSVWVFDGGIFPLPTPHVPVRPKQRRMGASGYQQHRGLSAGANNSRGGDKGGDVLLITPRSDVRHWTTIRNITKI